MYCNKCGKYNPQNNKYCKYCGARIEKISDDSDHSSDNEHDVKKTKGGITGWLALLALGIIINPFLYGYSLLEYFPLLGDYYFPGYSSLLLFEFVMTLVFFCATIYFVFIFFNKKRVFPNYYFIFLIGTMVFVGVDYIWLASLEPQTLEQQQAISDIIAESAGDIVRTFVISSLWALYLKKSKKVKATFVND